MAAPLKIAAHHARRERLSESKTVAAGRYKVIPALVMRLKFQAYRI